MRSHFTNWKISTVNELQQLRQILNKNAKQKLIVADLSLDKQMLEDVFSVKPRFKWMEMKFSETIPSSR